MDALKFLKEHARMCSSSTNLKPCPQKAEDEPWPCNVCVASMFVHPEARIALVEKWSSENPIVTNREKFIKDFGFDGSRVCDMIPAEGPFHLGSCGYKNHCTDSCASRNYPRCPKWWKDPYIPKEK